MPETEGEGRLVSCVDTIPTSVSLCQEAKAGRRGGDGGGGQSERTRERRGRKSLQSTSSLRVRASWLVFPSQLVFGTNTVEEVSAWPGSWRCCVLPGAGGTRLDRVSIASTNGGLERIICMGCWCCRGRPNSYATKTSWSGWICFASIDTYATADAC